MPARRLLRRVTSPATVRTPAGRRRDRSNVRTRAVTSQSWASSASIKCRPRQPVPPVTKTFTGAVLPHKYVGAFQAFDDFNPGREEILQFINVRNHQDPLKSILCGVDGF